MVTMNNLLIAVIHGLDDYLITLARGNGKGAREIRHRCLVDLDCCFDLIDRSVEECHGDIARHQDPGAAAKLTVVDGGLN